MADQTDHQVTEGGHDSGAGSGLDLGSVLTERDVADPVDFVLDGPVPPGVGGQMFRGGLLRAEAGDPEHRDRRLDLDGLVPAAVLDSFADIAGGVM